MKNILIGTTLFFIGVFVASGNHADVKGAKTEPTIAVVTNTPVPTATITPTTQPTNTPSPRPTITPKPTKKYIAPTPTPTKVPQTYSAPTSSGLSNDNHYINSAGNEVHSPAYSDSVPAGATALCGDGTYSFSQSHRGTCSHHGGVASWL